MKWLKIIFYHLIGLWVVIISLLVIYLTINQVYIIQQIAAIFELILVLMGVDPGLPM